ncbi:MAG: rod shape-determining protein MreC [Candidatus Faecousia sp.]|nr:rod shape-determining protein MreC [Oscillospiraceae bacterium]MDD6856698.1 rod shape-determining protein MreC [Oscillospiraceae bacterium]MDY2557906.1 rod shape-determining protein MreC [Candidatus Faecousia sp.]
MKQLFSTKLRIILVLVVLVTAALSVVAGLTNQSVPDLVIQGLLTPFRSAATALTNTVERYYSYMFKYEALEAENQVLKAQIAQMEDVARQADATSRENERLRKTIKLQNAHESYVLQDAYIIGWSSTDFTSVLTINRGSDAGIATNMCAVTETGEVVGLVTQVGKNYAEVKTVLDSTLEISSTISSSGYNGMVKGGYMNGTEKLLKMDYLPSAAIIRNNQQVVTSGSTVYPRGLIVGSVVDAGFEQTGVAKYALLKSAADIDSLEQIFIITQYTTDVDTAGASADGSAETTAETTAPTE